MLDVRQVVARIAAAPRKTWLKFAAVVGVVCLAVLVSLPFWLPQRLAQSLASRAGARLGATVELDGVALQGFGARIERITITRPAGEQDGEAFTVVLEDVRIEATPVLPGWFELTNVDVTQGAIVGSRAGLEAMVRSARRQGPSTAPGKPSGGRSSRMIPEHFTLQRAQLDITRITSPTTGRMQGELRLETHGVASATWKITQFSADGVRNFGVRADELSGIVSTTRDGDGRLKPALPLNVRVHGGAIDVTPRIALAGVEGEVAAVDERLENLTIALSGGFADRAQGGRSGAEPKLWSVKGRVRRDLKDGEIALQMEAFELGRIPQVLAKLPLVDSERARAGGHLALRFGPGPLELQGALTLSGFNVAHPVLARDPVRDVGLDVDFAASIDLKERVLELTEATFERKGVAAKLRGRFAHPPQPERRAYELHVEMPQVKCQAVLEAIPAELVPSLQGFQLRGNFAMQIDFQVAMNAVEELVLSGKVGSAGCRVQRAPLAVSVGRLSGPMTHRVSMRDGTERVVRLFPGSGSFTPLSMISPYMVAAVLTTEDGGFFSHHGFMPSQFAEALKRNLAAGHVRLGASTITMQMVKNVLLSHERTLSRKLQELVLTWYVEQSLSKERIMEIYLNVIEFGPGIYGITRAAQHYFGKQPGDLQPPEAAYLALMLPSPVRRHEHYCRQQLSKAFKVKVERILGIMLERERITQLEHDMWAGTELLFDGTDLASETECLREIARLLEAEGGQRALTGLLAGGPDADESMPEWEAGEGDVTDPPGNAVQIADPFEAAASGASAASSGPSPLPAMDRDDDAGGTG